MPQTNRYQPLIHQLEYLEAAYHLHICVKDYVGFIPIDKELSAALTPYLGHSNPYCMFIKQSQSRYYHCLSMMKKMANKCLTEGCTYRGACYAGVGEYVSPILWEGKLLGAVTAGFLPMKKEEAQSRIAYAMTGAPEEELTAAQRLYEQNILPTAVPEQTLLPALDFVASYLAMTYRMGQESVTGQHLVSARKRSGTDELLTHAVGFLHQEYQNPITISLLAAECHCSESSLNHMFKKRLGVSMSTYVNKLRVERAKRYLLETDDSMLSIALSVGFRDGNYFARVFRQLIGIQPTEFRRRYR